eukprot:403333433
MLQQTTTLPLEDDSSNFMIQRFNRNSQEKQQSNSLILNPKIRISQHRNNAKPIIKIKQEYGLNGRPTYTANPSPRNSIFKSFKGSGNQNETVIISQNDQQKNHDLNINTWENQSFVNNSNNQFILPRSQKVSQRRKNNILMDDFSTKTHNDKNSFSPQINPQNKKAFFGNPSTRWEDIHHQNQRSLLIDKQLLDDLGETLQLTTSYGGFSLVGKKHGNNLKANKQQEIKAYPLEESQTMTFDKNSQLNTMNLEMKQARKQSELYINKDRFRSQQKERRKQSIDTEILNKDIFNQNAYLHLQSTQDLSDKLNEIKKSERFLLSQKKYEIDLNYMYEDKISEKRKNQDKQYTDDPKAHEEHVLYMNMIDQLQNIRSELELNYSMYEKRKYEYVDTPDIINGTEILVKQFHLDMLNEMSSKSNLQEETFITRIKEATNIFRQILRTIEVLCQRKDLSKHLSVFWKSLVLLLEMLVTQEKQTFILIQDKIKEELTSKIQVIQQDHSKELQTLKTTIQERDQERKVLEIQVDKGRIEIERLKELLRDREYELKKLQDPYSLMELKSLMNDLESNIECVQIVKNQQYSEMNQIVHILDSYDKEYQNRKLNNRMRITIPKRKTKKNNEMLNSFDSTNLQAQQTKVIIKVQKQHDVSNKMRGIIGQQSSSHLSPINTIGNRQGTTGTNAGLPIIADDNSIDSFRQMISEDGEPVTPTNLTRVQYKDKELDLFGMWSKNLDVIQEQRECLYLIKDLNSNDNQQAKDQQKIEITVSNLLKHQQTFKRLEKFGRGELKDQSVQTEKVGIGKSMDTRDNQSNSGSKSRLQSSRRVGEKGYLAVKQQTNQSNRNEKSIGIKDFIVGSQNELTNEQAKKFMKKNPILQIIKQSFSEKFQKQMSQSPIDLKQKMVEPNIIKLIEEAMDSKVKADLDQDLLQSCEERDYQMFTTYMYDSLLMQYGLKTIANKNIIMINNGLKSFEQYPYGNLISRILGISEPYFMRDSVSIIVRAHLFFKEVQQDWVKRLTKMNQKVSEETVNNLKNGGECMIFDIIDELRIAFKDDKELTERILSNIKPDNYKAIDHKDKSKMKTFQIEFSVLKITSRIAKLGKDLKFIYDTLDKDKSGSLEPNELLIGLKNSFNVYLSLDESVALSKYLDEDESGDIDFSEFVKKINLGDLQNKAHLYTISKVMFMDLMLKEWEFYLRRERPKIIEVFKEFDDNGDGVLVLDEFETLLKSLEPSISKKGALRLFKQTITKFENKQIDDDKLSPEAFCHMVQYNKLGGFGKELFNDYFRHKIAPSQKLLSKKTMRMQ